MNYRVVLTTSFRRSIKKLKKRFPHVKTDTSTAVNVLLEMPYLGVLIPGSSGVRKLRVRNTDIRKGKRAGYRLLYYVIDEPERKIYLLLMYAKSDRADVARQELTQLLQEVIGS